MTRRPLALSAALLLCFAGCAARAPVQRVDIVDWGWDKKALDARYAVRQVRSEYRYVLMAGAEKVLSNDRGIPLTTNWIESKGRHYLVIRDAHATGNTKLWILDPSAKKCWRVDRQARRDLLRHMKVPHAKEWSDGYGINKANGALHIGLFARCRVKRANTHYDVDLHTGEIVKRYAAMVTNGAIH